MNARARGAAALSLGVAGAFACAWVFWAHGVVATVATVFGAAAAGLGVALVRERRELRRLESALGRESERARNASDHAWQSALLSQFADELRTSPDTALARGGGYEASLLHTAATALVNILRASRVVVYRRDRDHAFLARAQSTAEGVAPLDEDATLPAVLASDRELAARVSASNRIEAENDPEVRALVERLGVRSILIEPVGDRRMLAVHQCDGSRSWTEIERRFVQRFADQLATALARADEHRRQSEDVEVRSGLLRVARLLSGARESKAVLDTVTSTGATLARARASAIYLHRDGSGLELAAEHGFATGVARACVESLDLEDVTRTRPMMRLRSDDRVVASAESASLGPVALVPLCDGRQSFGVLLFEKPPSEVGWSQADADTAEALGELTAAALTHAKLIETLASAEARYVELYDNAPDLYQTVDRGGRVLDCNLTQCKSLGYAKEDLVGRRVENFLSPECVATWRALEAELFERGSVKDARLELRSREGENIDVVVNASVVRAGEAEPLSARVVMRDVREQRRLEQQLRQRQKLEVVGALAGGIAHDFNNVLGGILGNASLLQAQLGELPYARRYVDTIERSAVRGAELAGRLLAAFRKAPARREAVNVNDVVEETLELLAQTFHKKVRISMRLDPRARPMLADAGQLQQVVLNLCVNARDAMPEGGLLQVVTEVDEREKRLRLTVEDSGVGIEPVTIGRLFEPFFSTKGKGGTGLGLSVVYGIVKSLGGDVRVNSSPGQGARFEIFLPTGSVAAHEQPAPPVEPARGRGELVLLVDDELVLRELGKEILENHGYRVETVGSGEEALSFLRDREEAVALVILDLVMPGLDGGETFRRLRDVDTDVPVLLSSGLSAEDAVQEILSQGARGFIPKPYGMVELTRAVSTVLQGEDPPLMH